MHRTKLLNLLENYVTEDKLELQMLLETIAFVSQNEDCFMRELLEGHITASAWIIDQNTQKTVLIHHKKLQKWFQPGGHCDGNADVLSVAFKELAEETGLNEIKILSENIFDVDIHQIPERKGIPSHLHYDIRFLFLGNSSETPKVSDESLAVEWVSWVQIPDFNSSESILRMLRKSQLL